MPSLVIVGMQWGDEGKGKIVDLICPAFDAVVRYQGGHNAGHTVKFGDRHFSLHLIPSGIVRPGTACVLGNGMVVAPDAFLAERDALRRAGIDDAGRLFVAHRAAALLPWHAELDRAREAARGDGAIGTTARGIGPAYESKAGRYGLRMVDLLAPDLSARLERLRDAIAPQLAALGAPPPAPAAAEAERCRAWAAALAEHLADGAQLLGRWLAAGKSLLFEGAQGALLDLDHGSYPFVTSSSATAGGAAPGAGVAPAAIDGAVGVLKAYGTRVGGGPFATELTGELGEHLRRRGNEYGTTTGRPRRCGWLDAVAGRYGQLLNGVAAIALTKLDVLDELDEIRVATAYRIGGREVADFPADLAALEAAEPVYTTLPGWRTSTAGALAFDDLPPAARDYVAFIEAQLGAPVELISTGPRREETIVRAGGALERLTGGRLPAVAGETA
jgi:adenylosuccinate synthase